MFRNVRYITNTYVHVTSTAVVHKAVYFPRTVYVRVHCKCMLLMRNALFRLNHQYRHLRSCYGKCILTTAMAGASCSSVLESVLWHWNKTKLIFKM